jgi:hypothetical protein
MNKEILSRSAVLAKYPETKPICLNYAAMRAELLALAEENEVLRSTHTEPAVK